jgi:putative transposase
VPIGWIPTAQGGLYVAVVLDLKSRKVIGWSMRDNLEQTLVHEALEMALGQRPSTEVPNELLQEFGIVCSMSRLQHESSGQLLG